MWRMSFCPVFNGTVPPDFLETEIELGGGLGIGAHVPNQTFPPDRLNLTQTERVELFAFLKSLTDTTGTTRQCRPLR